MSVVVTVDDSVKKTADTFADALTVRQLSRPLEIRFCGLTISFPSFGIFDTHTPLKKKEEEFKEGVGRDAMIVRILNFNLLLLCLVDETLKSKN